MGKIQKKKESKLSIISDLYGNILDTILIDTNEKKNINFFPKEEIIQTLPHDSTTIRDSLKIIIQKNIKYKQILLVCDKGYSTKKRKEINYLLNIKLN